VLRHVLTVPQHLALLMIAAYQVLLSPWFGGACRFLPSCSDYARDAVLTHGVLAGSLLAVKRIGRCHPWAAAGIDPVPARDSHQTCPTSGPRN
jgi:putative membrane protein insertion efficiency factor